VGGVEFRRNILCLIMLHPTSSRMRLKLSKFQPALDGNNTVEDKEAHLGPALHEEPEKRARNTFQTGTSRH